jgi:hypothetical protein
MTAPVQGAELTAPTKHRQPWWVWVLVALGVLNFVNAPIAIALFYLGWWPFN